MGNARTKASGSASFFVLTALLCLAAMPLLAEPSPTKAPPQPLEALALVTRSLSGAASSPMADGEVGIVSISLRDRAGRLALVGWAAAKEGGSGAASGTAAGQAPSDPTKPPVQAPASAASVDDLALYDIGWDSRGRVTSVAERKGGAPFEALTTYTRDDTGRLVRVERDEKGKVAAALSLQWDGEGRMAQLFLFDGKGSLKGSGLLRSGVAGIADRTALINLSDDQGADEGGLSLAWDSAGRLTEWKVLAKAAKPRTTATGADSKAADIGGSTGSVADGANGAASKSPGIAELLFPFWPKDAASFELLAELAAPMARADFRAFAASGPFVLPFERPKDGAVELLWDGQGRLLEGRELDAASVLLSSFSCRYDRRGLLAEERYATAGASILYAYRLDSKGGWSACSSFLMPEDARPGILTPLAWFSRQKIGIPPPGKAESPTPEP